MTKDPYTLASIFCGLQLLNQESNSTAVVWVCGVDVVEIVASVPEVGIQGDNPQLWVCWMVDTISSVVHSSLRSCGSIDPAIVLPQRRNMVIVPGLLLSKDTR